MKHACKQAIFRKDTRRVRRSEDPLRAGDQEERELEFFNNHNFECGIISHWGVIVCRIHTRDLAKTLCYKSGMVHTIPFHLKYTSTPNQSTVIWMVFSFHMSPYTHVQHLLEPHVNSLSPFLSGYRIRIPQSFLETLWFIRI